MFAERDIRQELGAKCLNATYESELSGDKPKESLSINRIMDVLIKIPPNHPVVILLWQAFFSLIFEQSSKPGPFFQKNIGLLLVDGKKIDQLENLIFGSMNSNSQSSLMKEYLKAMHGWLLKKDLIAVQDANIRSLEKPELLSSCVRGSLFENGTNSWWVDLVKEKDNNQQSKPQVEIWNVAELNISAIMPGHGLLKIEFKSPMISDIKPSEVHTVFASAIDILKNKARFHSAFLKESEENDQIYLKDILKLYKCDLAPSNMAKKCKTDCAGILFTYSKQVCEIDVGVSKNLEIIQGQADTLLKTDFVDEGVTIASLKMDKCLELMSKPGYESKSALKCLADCLNLLEMRIQSFPPAGEIIEKCIKLLGKSFVIGSLQETNSIFKTILQGNNIKVLCQIFEAPVERFIESFNQATSLLFGENLALVLACFSVNMWVAVLKQEDLEPFFKLMEDCLEAFALHNVDKIGFEAIAGFLRQMVNHRPLSSLQRITSIIFAKIIQENIDNSVILYIGEIFLGTSIRDFPNDPTLILIAPFSKSELWCILQEIQTEFGNQIAKDSGCFHSFSSRNCVQLACFLRAMFSARQIYDVGNEEFVFELGLKLISLIFGVTDNEVNDLGMGKDRIQDDQFWIDTSLDLILKISIMSGR